MTDKLPPGGVFEGLHMIDIVIHHHNHHHYQFKPDDIFEGLSNVHDQVPYEDDPSSHSTINVPKPETEN